MRRRKISKRKEEKGKKRGDFFLFCVPLSLAAKVKIDGGAGKLTRQRQPKTKKNWQWWRDFLVAHTRTRIHQNLKFHFSEVANYLSLYRKITFSDTGNLFLERIKFGKFAIFEE